jgi:putative salt-induced outer membrane protein YdiY
LGTRLGRNCKCEPGSSARQLQHHSLWRRIYGGSATAHRQTQLYANTLYSTNGNATPSTSANAKGGGIRYDHNLNPRTFVFATGDFYSDALQELDLREILGGGFGRHASKTPRQTLDVLCGIVWDHESCSATASSANTKNSFPALDLGENYSRNIGDGSALTEQAYIYPNLSSPGKYQFSLTTGFSTKLGKMFNWATNLSDNYTTFPPAGAKINDMVLTTGLGITLARP